MAMITPIDNHSIAEAADVVFSNSNAYVVELPMVGREAETAKLLEALLDVGKPRLVTISAPLGAGKTFLLSTIFGRLGRELEGFDERRDKAVILATDLMTPDDTGDGVVADLVGRSVAKSIIDPATKFEKRPGRKVLVIEELDRKATLAQLKWAVVAGLAWLHEGNDRVLVLTGDATISGKHVAALLEGESVERVELGPLDLDLLKLAIASRLRDKVLRPRNPTADDSEVDDLAKLAAEQVVADDFIRWSAVPLTDPRLLANFRDALGVLRSYAKNARSHKGAVEFERKLINAMVTSASGLPPRAAQVADAIKREVAKAIETDTPMSAYSSSDLAALAGVEDSPEFEARYVRMLVRSGLLTALGIPFDNVDTDGSPLVISGPYLPSYRMVHLTLADLVPSTS